MLNSKYIGIHIGGGSKRINSFLNIDLNPYANSDIISGTLKLKLNSNSVKYIYNSHILEHVPRKEIYATIQEWYRVLEENGRLFICVPDVENLFKIYLENIEHYEKVEKKKIVDLSCGIIFGGQVDEYDFHYMGYSFVTLKYVLEDVGFKDIRRFVTNELPFNKLNDGSEIILEDRDISLKVVAIK